MYSRRPSSLGFPSEVAQSAYYSGDERITREEIDRVSKIVESERVYPENTRIHKESQGDRIVYNVLQASIDASASPSGRRITVADSLEEILITQGDHAEALTAVSQSLKNARHYASNAQQMAVIDQYLKSFETGDIEAFKESQRLWVKDLQPTIENAFGFVEPYRDPYGTRAEFEGIVAFVDVEETRVLTKLVNSSAEFICNLPWTKNATENNGKGHFEKELFDPPDFTSLQSMPNALTTRYRHRTISHHVYECVANDHLQHWPTARVSSSQELIFPM